jgi:nitroreductase
MIKLLRARRSIRSYTRQPVDKESVELLIEAALRAPSSRNNQPWSFVVVDDRQLLEKLSLAKENGSVFLSKASLGIVVCGDPAKSDVWVEDCAIAAALIQLEAQSLGLGSCWIQIRERRHDAGTMAQSYLQEVLGIPAQIMIACIISIGHPAEVRTPVAAADLDHGKVRHNSWTVTPFGT